MCILDSEIIKLKAHIAGWVSRKRDYIPSSSTSLDRQWRGSSLLNRSCRFSLGSKNLLRSTAGSKIPRIYTKVNSFFVRRDLSLDCCYFALIKDITNLLEIQFLNSSLRTNSWIALFSVARLTPLSMCLWAYYLTTLMHSVFSKFGFVLDCDRVSPGPLRRPETPPVIPLKKHVLPPCTRLLPLFRGASSCLGG